MNRSLTGTRAYARVMGAVRAGARVMTEAYDAGAGRRGWDRGWSLHRV